ncbi:MAG: DUF3794 domain-containing protein [Clostridia bacterium]|nr:DUF3794 domain-containing protein [Clostridia bacterium]
MPELIKNYVKTSRLLKTEVLRSVFDSDYTIPEGMPEIKQVLAIDTEVFVEKTTAENDRVTAEILIEYTVLYMPSGEDVSVKSVTFKNQQTFLINATGIEDECRCVIKCCAEQTEITNVNGRRLSVRSVVKCSPHIENISELAIPSDIAGIDDIQVQEDICPMNVTVENLIDVLDINENIELPVGKDPFYRIIKSNASVSDVTFNVASNELTVKGNLNVCTLYESDGVTKNLQIIENEIPFSEVIFVENDNGTLDWNVDYSLTSFNAEASEDSDGEKRILNVTAAIKFDVTSSENVSVNMLSDAYSLSCGFDLQRKKIDVYTKCGEVSSQFVLKNAESVPEGLPAISEIVNLSGQIGQMDVSAEDGGAVIEGVVICNVLYLSKDESNPVASFAVQIPFTQRIDRRDMTPETIVNLSLNVNHTSYSLLSPTETELRIALSARGETLKSQSVNMIYDVSPVTELDPTRRNQASILIYIVQPGDTMWKIAKRYNAPIEILKSINDIENADLIMPGQKLLIPKN